MIWTIFAVLGLLLVLDCLQTMAIADLYPWRERNPVLRWLIADILERDDRRAMVWVYFALATCAIVVAAVILSEFAGEAWAFGFLVGLIALELYCVVNNHRIGIRPYRPFDGD